VKFMILLHSNPRFAQRWEALTPEQRSRFGVDHIALSRELTESGELLVSEGLADPSLARWVSTADGSPVVADGPFAETKEHLAGFYLLDVESAARAEEIAARVPDAVWGLVEVRPVLDMSGWDV
jgi:hypothetical protein